MSGRITPLLSRGDRPNKGGVRCSRPTTHLKGNDAVGHSNNVVGWVGHSTSEVVVNHLLTLKGGDWPFP